MNTTIDTKTVSVEKKDKKHNKGQSKSMKDVVPKVEKDVKKDEDSMNVEKEPEHKKESNRRRPRKLAVTKKIARRNKPYNGIVEQLKIGNTQQSMQRRPIERLIREIAQNYTENGIRFQDRAISMLHSVCEAELTSLFKSTSKLLENAKRVTADNNDLRTVMRIKEIPIYNRYINEKPNNVKTKIICEKKNIDITKISKFVEKFNF
jgi:histone H3/H4